MRDASVESERKGKGSALANSFCPFPRRLYFVRREHVTRVNEKCPLFSFPIKRANARK